MTTKVCKKCKINKIINEFYKHTSNKDGYRGECKKCCIKKNTIYNAGKKEELKQYSKQYYQTNKEKNKEHNKKYWQEHKKELTIRNKIYRETHKDEIREKNKNNIERKKKGIAHAKHRFNTEPFFKLKQNTRNLIRKGFKNKGFRKNTKTEQILGCTFEKFKIYIENQFQPWMNWDNRGLYNGQPNYGWDIDHKIPLSTAKASEDIIRLNHYTNFQPLCSYINRVIKRTQDGKY